MITHFLVRFAFLSIWPSSIRSVNNLDLRALLLFCFYSQFLNIIVWGIKSFFNILSNVSINVLCFHINYEIICMLVTTFNVLFILWFYGIIQKLVNSNSWCRKLIDVNIRVCWFLLLFYGIWFAVKIWGSFCCMIARSWNQFMPSFITFYKFDFSVVLNTLHSFF